MVRTLPNRKPRIAVRVTTVLVAAAVLGTTAVFGIVTRIEASSHPYPTDPTGRLDPTVYAVERGMTFEQLRPAPADAPRLYDIQAVDPGVPAEGDNLGRTVFTRDGSRILVTNMMTDNVTVFDWPGMNVAGNVPVGHLPYGVAVTDEYAVVACPMSNAVYVIRLLDLTVAGVVATGEWPWIVRTSPDGRFAYVSCEISDTCEKIDLQSMTTVLVIPDFPMEMTSYSWNSENGRFWPTFLTFELTPDGRHAFTGDWNDSVRFYDTTTGALDHVVAGVPNCVSVALSGDGSRAVAMSIGLFQLHQIELTGYTKTATVTPAGLTWGATYDMGVNQDASKVYVSAGDNQGALIRFATNDFVLLPQTLSAYWVGTSPDHAYAVSGQNTLSIVSFSAESVVGQVVGYPQISGAVSPIGRYAAAFDPHRHEGLFFFEYTNPSAPAYLGTTPSGQEPEGDGSRRVLITPDGTRAVVANVLSANLTILDLQECAIAALVTVGSHPQEVAITSDSRWALVTSLDPGALTLVDLATYEPVAVIPCGVFPTSIAISPDDQTAYVGDIALNQVMVVRLAGAASEVVAQVPVGEIGRLLVGGSVASDVVVSPDGNEVLVAVSFENKVRVIDTETNTVVAEIWVNGTFPIQIAFDATGDYATVTNFGDDTVTTMRIDGAASNRVDCRGRGDGPLRLAFNAARDEIGVGILDGQAVVCLDPATGELRNTYDYSPWGSVLQVRFDERGEPLVLAAPSNGPETLVRGGVGIPMPAPGYYFDYCPGEQVAVVACPGPDFVVVVRWDTTGSPDLRTIPLGGAGLLDPVRPNPVSGESRLGFSLAREAVVEMLLVDVLGRELAQLARGSFGPGHHEVKWSRAGLPAGTYFAVLRMEGAPVDTRKVVLLDR